MHKIFHMPFADVYPHYLRKVEKKGRTKEELLEVISWLTSFSKSDIEKYIENKTNFEDFFKAAKINSNATLITGSICGVKIQEIEDPLMLNIRYMDKLVDELAKGRQMSKILRT